MLLAMSDGLKQRVLAEAHAAGFNAARVTTPAGIDAAVGERLADFLRQGRHGGEGTVPGRRRNHAACAVDAVNTE